MAVHPAIDERVVAEVWERQAFDPAVLAPHGLRVLYRGVPSDAGGPDYQDALLVRDDQTLVAGDIEFHVETEDWVRHGHHADARYNSVVLHVVWRYNGGSICRQDGTIVPTIGLEHSALIALPSPPPVLAEHGCIAAFRALAGAEIEERIAAAGRLRFEERRDRFAAELETADPDQVLYRALFESMGFAANRQAFLRLADAVPYAWLAAQPPQQREGLLLAAAGLSSESGLEVPGRIAAQEWRLSRLRPSNHPAVRLAGLAALVSRLSPSLSDRAVEAVLGAGRPSELRRLLRVSENHDALIGAGRADEVIASALLPFAAAVVPVSHRPAELFARYPAPPATRWTRLMVGLLRDAGHPVKLRSAPQHQGLHHLYTRFCRYEGREGCPMCRREAT